MIRYFSNHPTAANLIMVALLVLGLSSVSSMKRETFPSIKSSKVSVSVVYRGATAKEVEDAICRRMEDAIKDVNDLDEVRCEAREGNAKLTAIMLEGAQMSRFVNDIKSEVDTINDQPAQAEAPITTELGLSERVISIAVTGFEDARELREYVNAFKDRLAALSEVSSVAVRGFSVRQL